MILEDDRSAIDVPVAIRLALYLVDAVLENGDHEIEQQNDGDHHVDGAHQRLDEKKGGNAVNVSVGLGIVLLREQIVIVVEILTSLT